MLDHDRQSIAGHTPWHTQADAAGRPGPQARRAARLAEAIRQRTSLPVSLYDESYSTQAAQTAMLAAGKKRRARRAQEHAVAAAAFLQSYLDAHPARD